MHFSCVTLLSIKSFVIYFLVKFSNSVIIELDFCSLDKDAHFLRIADVDLFCLQVQELIYLQGAHQLVLHSARLADPLNFVLSSSTKSHQCFMILAPSRLRPEDHVSFLENLQHNLTNDSSINWLQDLRISLCWIDFKSHQCLLMLVPSRLRPEEHASLLKNLHKYISMVLSSNWLQELSNTLIWPYCISLPKFLWLDFSKTHAELRSGTHFSSYKERSSSPPSSRMERIFLPPSPFTVEPFMPQSQTLLYAVDNLLAGPRTLFASTSTKFEFMFRTISSTALKMFCSITAHIVLYENLQDYRELKKRFISIYAMFFFNLSWIDCNFEF